MFEDVVPPIHKAVAKVDESEGDKVPHIAMR